MNIAIIPARSGSKRIKNKNIKRFCKKPIIYWSIKAAIKSKVFKKIYVSTDSKKIANLSKKFGAEVPFLRSKKLSNNKAGTSAVIRNFIKNLDNKSKIINVCCIYPTAPFLKAADIRKGLNILKTKKFNYVFTATKYTSNFHRSFTMNKKQMKMLFKKIATKNSRLTKRISRCCSVLLGPIKIWSMKKKVFNKFNKNRSSRDTKKRSCDIDTLEDWRHAEKLSRFNKI